MNKKTIIAFGLGLVIAVGLSVLAQQNAIVAADIGVVDDAAVIRSYPKAKELEEKQRQLNLELQKFAADAKYKVAMEKTPEKRKELETKLNKELKDKKKSLDKEYQTMLTSVQKAVFEAIKSNSEAKGLKVALKKSSVLYGGTDITKDVIDSLKK